MSKIYDFSGNSNENERFEKVLLTLPSNKTVFSCPEDLANAFEKHVATYGGLDICINSAGISNPIIFQKDQTDGTRSWRHTINVNFVALIDSTRHAVRCWSFN